MRVAQLIPTDLRPYRVGFYTALDAVEGMEVEVYAGQPASGSGAPFGAVEIPQPVIELRNLYWPGSHKTAWQRGALGMLRSDADVLVIPEIVHSLTVWALRLAHRRFQKRLVVHGFFYRSPSPRRGLRTWARNRLRAWLRSSAAALVTYTEKGRDALIAEGEEPARVFVSRNTLDTNALTLLAESITDRERDEVRQDLRLTGDGLVVAWLGRLLPDKRPDLVVDAVDVVARSGRDIRLLVIGDGPLRSELESRADLAPITFLGAIYDERAIARVFSVSDVLVVPGRIGLSCVHAFANGVPAVTSDQALISQSPEYDYIDHESNGLIVSELTIGAYVSTFDRMFADQGLVDRLRQGARRSAAELSVDEMVAGFVGAVRHASRVRGP